MAVTERTIRRVIWRRSPAGAGGVEALVSSGESAELPAPVPAGAPAGETFEIAANDPLIAYLQGALGALEVAHLELDSPALAELRAAGVAMIVPLISNGELIGVLSVGRRRSDQDFSADDRRLLETLAAQAAPAVRVGQLVREQQAEIEARGRIEQELAVAQLIQQNFLPKELPALAGWQVAAYYGPARAVGGDFYDFIELPDGLLGLVIGDVTDKGIPAAMVMAATRSVLRASAQRLLEPGQVLARVNDSLCPDIPENMFVTCFYGVLDPSNGRLRYANAGHNLPLVSSPDGSAELRATGMPLGLMPGMSYEERETTLAPDSCVLLYSDGLVEAHDRGREMFGTDRVRDLLAGASDSQGAIDALRVALDSFTSELEQEDDITLVALRHLAGEAAVLADFTVASAPGNEREAMSRVAAAASALGLAPARLERLKTATAEATMNAMEHGNAYAEDLDVRVVVRADREALTVAIVDHGGEHEIAPAQAPDIDAKLDGLQSPRGWGLFLIEQMVDELRQHSDGQLHTVELVTYLKGDADDQNRA
jgi:serine phosphatase RsbU (regulator of sigma subunit)/anti-sigma regulatory factor (Ser/Thr protein kinase)